MRAEQEKDRPISTLNSDQNGNLFIEACVSSFLFGTLVSNLLWGTLVVIKDWHL